KILSHILLISKALFPVMLFAVCASAVLQVGLIRIMFNINPLENLRVYISSRPPLVVFMISVSAMAIAFLTLGYFFKIKEIKSPEMAEDWNTFLLRFNDLDFCISENETLKHLINDTTTPENAMTSSQARPSTPSPQTLEDSGPVNTSVAITLTLDPLRPFGGISRNVTGLSSTIFGHQIGLSGLPLYDQPPHCIPETYINATFWYKIVTTARDSNTKYAQDYNPFWCYKGAIGKVYHALNPKLTVIVPDDDRSLINLHLMHTSYFLFVMVITMFCYAVIRGRPIKLRQSSSEFCPEKNYRILLLSQKHDPLPPSSKSDQVCNHCLLNPEMGPDWLWIYHETLDYSNQRLLKCL
ncbi:hypothetical protein E2320_018290, partial [Naja naja]